MTESQILDTDSKRYLTPRQRRYLIALATRQDGVSTADIQRECRVTARTAARWSKSPYYCRVLRNASERYLVNLLPEADKSLTDKACSGDVSALNLYYKRAGILQNDAKSSQGNSLTQININVTEAESSRILNNINKLQQSMDKWSSSGKHPIDGSIDTSINNIYNTSDTINSDNAEDDDACDNNEAVELDSSDDVT